MESSKRNRSPSPTVSNKVPREDVMDHTEDNVLLRVVEEGTNVSHQEAVSDF